MLFSVINVIGDVACLVSHLLCQCSTNLKVAKRDTTGQTREKLVKYQLTGEHHLSSTVKKCFILRICYALSEPTFFALFILMTISNMCQMAMLCVMVDFIVHFHKALFKSIFSCHLNSFHLKVMLKVSILFYPFFLCSSDGNSKKRKSKDSCETDVLPTGDSKKETAVKKENAKKEREKKDRSGKDTKTSDEKKRKNKPEGKEESKKKKKDGDDGKTKKGGKKEGEDSTWKW